MKYAIALAAALSLVSAFDVFANDTPGRLSDAEVKRQIIKESIAAYSGNCPCPYNHVRADNAVPILAVVGMSRCVIRKT